MTRNHSDVFVGIDTHKGTHHVAVIDALGRDLSDCEFPATLAGYQAVAEFINSFGSVSRIGVEGTSSYGAGLTAFLRAEGFNIREVIRPNRQARRRGKSDPIDAYAAARSAVREDLPIPKLLGGRIDEIRALLRVRASAVKARTAALLQIKALLITTDPALREALEPLSNDQLISQVINLAPQNDEHTKRALARLGRRVQYLSEEIDLATEELSDLVKDIAPALAHAKGIGAISAAQLLVG